jgi:hypothetical protein
VIIIPDSTPLVCRRIVTIAQGEIPILENPIGSNRSPEIDAMCKEFGVPLASYWCALWTAHVWREAGAEIPPVSNAKGWHPAIAETWRQWAFQTCRFTSKPQLGYAVLYGSGASKPAHHIGCAVVSTFPIVMDLEGNTSETGFSREGEMTGLKRVDTARLIGYVSPLPLAIEAIAA